MQLKGHRFDSVGEVQAELQYVLNALTSVHCFQLWQGRWSRCINVKGDNIRLD